MLTLHSLYPSAVVCPSVPSLIILMCLFFPPPTPANSPNPRKMHLTTGALAFAPLTAHWKTIQSSSGTYLLHIVLRVGRRVIYKGACLETEQTHVRRRQPPWGLCSLFFHPEKREETSQQSFFFFLRKGKNEQWKGKKERRKKARSEPRPIWSCTSDGLALGPDGSPPKCHPQRCRARWPLTHVLPDVGVGPGVLVCTLSPPAGPNASLLAKGATSKLKIVPNP